MAKIKEEKGSTEKEGEEIARPLLESTGDADPHSRTTDAANSGNKAEEGGLNVSRQKEKDDFDSDALDPSIVPRGGGKCGNGWRVQRRIRVLWEDMAVVVTLFYRGLIE
jgi:hypothetical protein